jgi:Leucine-rich repeat (LRR) protein
MLRTFLQNVISICRVIVTMAAAHRDCFAYSLLEAVAILKNETQREFNLIVDLDWEGESHYALRLRQLAASLQSNANIDFLELHGWLSNVSLDESSSDHLFGSVMGYHPSLTKIAFIHHKIWPTFVNSFFSSFMANQHQSRLRELNLFGMRLDDEKCISIIAQTLRANSRLERLEIVHCRITSDGCNAIFKALEGNTHLKELDLSNNKISQVTLSAVTALASSNLQELELRHVELTTESIKAFAAGLRSNVSLEWLNLNYRASDEVHFKELLNTYNFNLRQLNDFYASEQIEELLRSNQNVRKAHTKLQGVSYHVGQTVIWPLALSKISSKPSLVYHFIRHGNLDACTYFLGSVASLTRPALTSLEFGSSYYSLQLDLHDFHRREQEVILA